MAAIATLAALVGPGAQQTEPGAALVGSSTPSVPTGTPEPPDSVLRAAAERIAEAVGDPDIVAPELAAEITAIESTASGWLLLVASEEFYPDDAHTICRSLSRAGALPDVLVFVADHRRHLVEGC